jgi:hypothetical protein
VRARLADLRARREHRQSTSGTPYAALHDIDANKPGGSIKIRVKTYAHTLKLHEEALEDMAKRADQLHRSVDQKMLELLTIKQQQLSARQITDPTLESQIQNLAEKLRSYEAPVSPPELPKGLVQIKKKQPDGSVVRV